MRIPRLHTFLNSSLAVTALAYALTALPAFADSQARIVRLSDVQGGVQINKNTGLGFENAFLNLPLTQGTQLRTRQNGRAEIEFEDGSTLRMTPNTTVEFGTLGVNDAGKHISTVNLVEGRAYVNWLGKSGDEFTLKFSNEKVALGGPAHFRVADSSGMVQVASFKNDLQVAAPSGAVRVDKKRMVAFDEDQNGQPSAAKKFDEDTYDQWDKQSVSYHDEYAKNNSSPYGYGASDLNYYGSYTNFPGYGMMWQPYFAGAGWNPYMDGAWSFYPGAGYLWASAYPWGWMPYYYGNWAYAPGFGWGWQPGAFNGWHGGVHVIGGTSLPVTVPKGTTSTVVVGRGGPVLSQAVSARTVINNGAAGLGIARGSVTSLHQLNTQVAKSGSVALHAAPQFAATSARAAGYAYGGDHPSAGASPGGHASPGASHPSAGGTHR
jgi:hypothetical protein